MPLSEISVAVGIRSVHVSRALKRLAELNIIERHSSKGVSPQTVSLVKNYDKWAVESCIVLPLPKTVTVTENGNPTITKNGNATITENGNPTITKNGNCTYKENIKEKKERGKERTPRGRYGNVFLSDDEIKKLNQDYGEDNIRTYIQKIDNYVQSKGRPYSDYAATLRSWLDKDGIKKSDFDTSKYDFVINNF